MKQPTLAQASAQGSGFEPYRKLTRQNVFLQAMDQLVP